MRSLVVLLLLIACNTLGAQNLVSNNSFENNCGWNDDLASLPCSTFTSNCVQGWTISHGTPQLISGNSPDQNWHIGVWACTGTNANYGEGIFNTLTAKVENGKYYNFCFWYKTTYGVNNGQGTITCELTNSNTRNGLTCGGYPLIMASQNITPPSATFPQPAWTYVSYTFQANADYLYLRIYPSSNAPVNDVAALEVDGFVLYPSSVCSGTLYLTDNNYVSSTGYYEQYAIVAGSTAAIPNSAPLLINPAINTIFKCNTGGYIELVDDFTASPDNNHYFETVIGPCGCPGSNDIPNRFSNSNQAAGEMFMDDIMLSPNPTTGIFTLKRNNEEAGTIEVSDLSGRSVTGKILLTGRNMELDLSNEPEGIYLVRIFTSSEVKTIRLVKN